MLKEIGEWGNEGIRGFKYFLTQSALATAIDREVAAVGEAMPSLTDAGGFCFPSPWGRVEFQVKLCET